MVLVCMRHLWTDWNLWNWFAKMEVGVDFLFLRIDINFGKVARMAEMNHCAIVGMRAGYQLWRFLEAVLLVSKFRAEITFYAVFVGGGWGQRLSSFCTTCHMDAVVWSCGSWGIRFLVYSPYQPTFARSYFVFSVTARNRKDFKHNASRLLDIQLLQTLHSDDSYVLRPEEWVCQIDCGRRKRVWKCTSPVDAIHNTMSEQSLCRNFDLREGVYCSLQDDVVSPFWLSRDVLLWDTFTSSCLRMVDFPRDWCALATATFLAGRFAAEWCIHIWIWCKRWTFGLNHPNPSLTLNAVITGRDDVVHYCGVWDSSRRTTVLFSSVIKVIDLYCWAWLWCLCSSMEVIVNTNFGRWACIAYFVIWHFCTTWFSGDFNDISRTDFTGDYVM